MTLQDRPNRKPWECFDCGRPNHDYFVYDSVWYKAWPTYAEDKTEAVQRYRGTEQDRLKHLFLCLDCLQKRLGRRLHPRDFKLEVPVNAGIKLGIEMGQMMGGGTE
jgi:hypothetical protein